MVFKLRSNDHSKTTFDNLKKLIHMQKTLSLATVSAEGISDIGYAPFVFDTENCFYIYVSELASHTRNLMVRPNVSVMLLRPEAETSNLFARERLIFQCKAQFIERSDIHFDRKLTEFYDRFGNIMDLLKNLRDFHLVQLIPEQGRYIAGFGLAYAIDLRNSLVIPAQKNGLVPI